MKKKILSAFLSLALILTAIPFTSIGAFATSGECSTYGHSYVEIYRLEATCETDGYIEYICQVCSGDSYQEPIPATGHSYVHLYTQDATCSQDGWSEYACMNCGNSYTDDFIPAYGCEMFASPQTPVGPFCDSYGFVEYKCDLCGTVVFTEELPPAGHSFGEWETIQYVTCEQEGINRRTCEVCGETEEEIIPKNIDHALDVFEYIPPTCVSNGYETIKCSICGFTDILQEYEATGHADTNNNGLCDVCEENEFTDSGKCGDNLIWTFDDTTGTLTISGTGPMDDYDYDNRPWENYTGNIENVVINNGVTTIGEYAFAWCPNLTSLTIGDSVATFGNKIFYASDAITEIMVDSNNPYYSSDEYGVLFNKDKTTIIQYPKGNTRTSYTIPDGVTTIGNYAFYLCTKLTSITIPDSVTTIEADAFYYCNKLTSITIPDSVKTIGNRAFVFCNSITSITVDSDNQYYSNDEYGVLFNKDKTTIIQYPTGNTRTSYTIPDGVTTIGNYAFHYCNKLTSITIPDSVTTIGDNAFHSCTCLTSVTIGDSVTTIGDDAFISCTCLTSVTIGDSVTTIGDDAFNYCNKLTSITIPDSVTTIGDYAFGYCSSLASVTIGDSVTTIGNYAFANCKLTSIILPDSVTKIGNYAFYDCNLRNVYYEGTSEQWESISISKYNESLLNATIHYNYIDPNKFTGIKDDCFYKNDVKQKAYQLVEFDGDFYYVGDCNKIVKSKRLYVTTERANGLTFADGTPIPAGWYEFDENGKMILFTGIVDDYAYVSGVKIMAYQLVEIDGDFYYVGDCNKIVKSKRLYVTTERANGLTFADGTPIPAGWYEFDENGKMILFSGIVDDYAYVSGVKIMAYQLVEIDGNFYYVGDCNKIVKDKRVYLTTERINELTFADGTVIEAGWYNFDADGKLIIE